MPEVQFAKHTVTSHGAKLARAHAYDWLILILLMAIAVLLNIIEPFHRYVNSEMMTDLKFPHKINNTIPMRLVQFFAVIVPCFIFLAFYVRRRDVYDLHHAIMGILYSAMVTAVITDAIKDAVGRPRPDFFYRCFPDGVAKFNSFTGNVICMGSQKLIKDGYKSFPSGHSSWAFAGLGFLGLYLCGKIKVFDRRGHAAKLCIVLIPYLFAALVGISRIDDYRHHWTDVLAGSLIGIVVSSVCYLQFFPSPNSTNGWATHALLKLTEEGAGSSSEMEIPYFRGSTPTAYVQGAMPDLEAQESYKIH